MLVWLNKMVLAQHFWVVLLRLVVSVFFYQKLIICSAGAMASVPRQLSTQLATVFWYNTIECVAYRQACGDTPPPPPP